ncbi:hypothetical protein BW723_00945 [Polaribacter reichenbachii]|uniref:Peptidase M56 domain-containing protein n=1 Tax=Polaribacter reichenbachii TaxID=996801 RepID=A0A1B8TRU6_9FLAO|nr:M56 family metallopeptidase [Polaribacter reichenbachii]APZ44939.1 hypothetical protein BW723_00945 [Polaribacter reichenbachii]AUC18802.1 hypothetical protein BTO17_08950 [Polaribacter reichenbachii]OBY62367.1 hypothetical protein LPB301_14745 [Polaribacter reichenbachii]
MIAYLLKSTTCLALLLAFYYLVLEREKMHNFNRFYLLSSVLFSFLVPLFIIYTDAAPIILENVNTPNITYDIEEIPAEIIVENPINYKSILMTLYFIISSILFIRLGRNLFNIINKTKRNTVIPYQKAILILVDDKILPHTFWNYIFINKNDYENKKVEKELFTHELTHVTQKHTLDILLLEILQAIFWINPFFILLKKAVQLNHEFLADERVIHQHKNITQYQHLLLNKAAWKNEYYLASNLNYSLTKKRLKMMTTQSSQVKILFKKLAVIPLLAGFIFLFAERVEAQKIIEVKEYIDTPINDLQIEDLEPEDIRVKLKDVNNLKISYIDKDTIIEKNKASQKQMNEYKKLLNEGKKHNIYKLKNIKKMQTIYSLMSEKQKNSVQNVSEIIPPPPPAMDTIYTYQALVKRTKFIPNNKKNNIQYLKVLYKKMSPSKRKKVESPNSISKYIKQLENLSEAQIKKVNEVYDIIRTKAKSKGRKFYTATEYKELENLYSKMLLSKQ